MTGIRVTQILGDIDDPQFAGRTVCAVEIGWGDANKHRIRTHAVDGRIVEIRLPRGTALDDGAVLWDDGTEIGAIRRPEELGLVVAFADNVSSEGVRQALLLGYMLGNQHAPLEVSQDEMRTPLLTSESAAHQALDRLGLAHEIRAVQLGARGWTNTSADHHGAAHPGGEVGESHP